MESQLFVSLSSLETMNNSSMKTVNSSQICSVCYDKLELSSSDFDNDEADFSTLNKAGPPRLTSDFTFSQSDYPIMFNTHKYVKV